MIQQQKSKLLSVSIVGAPNAGKSSLFNKILKTKLSIITPKVQTTRSIITGVFNIDNTQLILFDTPGIFVPKKRLEKSMVRFAWASLVSADLVAILIDSKYAIDDTTKDIIKKISLIGINFVFLLNKIDVASSYFVNENEKFLSMNYLNSKIFKISAKTSKNIEHFISFLLSKAKLEHWLFDKDDITNMPQKFFASEITREQLFLQLDQELPYNLSVRTESWKEFNNSVVIHQSIIVAKDSIKKIIIGTGGSKIKSIGIKSRINIEKFLNCKIELFLFVKVNSQYWDLQSDYLT
ncbi:GTPase Era [Rickettsia endosymbiont of Cardiosporidium cionae]|nr:GTPase Era [Rickettsia endosymbiont of Cardiosporidium cionae]KAF8818818.1 GTPase Era [Rickettsia endosymbiont of Cardiosporidium cionae]